MNNPRPSTRPWRFWLLVSLVVLAAAPTFAAPDAAPAIGIAVRRGGIETRLLERVQSLLAGLRN